MKKNPRMSAFLHVTRRDGKVVKVSRELILHGKTRVSLGGGYLGTVKELVIEKLVWERGA